jgi:hypothetical protein
MNIELIKSVVFKVVPVLVTYLVGKGIIDEATAGEIPGLIEALIVVAVTVPTIIRSLKTHKKAVVVADVEK